MRDYVAGKAAWLAAGLPTEGELGDARRVGSFVTSGGHGADDVELVLTAGGLVDGLVDPAVGVDLDPPTVRPSLPVRDLLDRFRSGDLDGPFVVVTTASGEPVGVVARDALLELARLDRLP